MVMATPSPQQVGREFVRQYYTVLHEAPEVLHRFYSSSSTFVHGGVDRPGHVTEEPVIGQLKIDKKIRSLNFKDCHTKIRQVDSQATIGNGVVVQVTGELSNNGELMRRFMQTFVLAPQTPKKYYVHNDIFRYQDEVYQDLSDAESEEQQTAQQQPQQANIMSGNYFQSNETNLIVSTSQSEQSVDNQNVVVVGNSAQSSVVAVTSAAQIDDSSSSLGRGENGGQLNGHLHSSNSSSSSSTSSQSISNIEKANEIPAQTPAVVVNTEQTISVHQPSTIDEEKAVNSLPSNDFAKKSDAKEITESTGGVVSAKQEVQNSDVKNSWAKIITNRTATGAAESSPINTITLINQQNQQYSSNSLPRNKEHRKGGGGHQQQQQQNGNTPPPPPTTTQTTKNHASSKSKGNQSNNTNTNQQQQANIQQQQPQQPLQTPPQQQQQQQPAQGQRVSTSTNGAEIDDIEKRFGRYPDGQQVFVGNLSQDLSEPELRQFFSQFGKVLEVRVNTNTKQQSGRRLPNYGFVVFDDKQSVDALLGQSKSNNLTYKNEKGNEYRLNVEEKRARQGRQSGFGGGGGSGHKSSSNRATRSTSNGSQGATNGSYKKTNAYNNSPKEEVHFTNKS